MARGPDHLTLTRHGLTDPVPRAIGVALRQAVLDHVSTQQRRSFAPVVKVGLPGHVVVDLPLGRTGLDHSLRVDVLEALVRRARRERVDGLVVSWLTRPGTLEPQDCDLEWSSAARSASYELGVALPLVVVTRQGWRDPATGATRVWQRLRPTRP